jgi:hypothetical protein
MKLFQLAYACRVYMVLTDSDVDYRTFLDKTGGRLDFKDSTHMNALLEWLRKWGCRQFAVDYHDLAAESIRKWAEQWNSKLPDASATLDRLTNEEIKEIGNAYADLSQSVASKRARDGGPNDVEVGPTGAAKILFAARPRVCPPWDGSIRGSTFDGSSDSYGKYLDDVRELVEQLCSEAAEFGIPPEEIPLEIGQPRSTLLKLVDEYNWVTVTKRSPPLEPHDIAKWHTWSRQP